MISLACIAVIVMGLAGGESDPSANEEVDTLPGYPSNPSSSGNSTSENSTTGNETTPSEP